MDDVMTSKLNGINDDCNELCNGYEFERGYFDDILTIALNVKWPNVKST